MSLNTGRQEIDKKTGRPVIESILAYPQPRNSPRRRGGGSGGQQQRRRTQSRDRGGATTSGAFGQGIKVKQFKPKESYLNQPTAEQLREANSRRRPPEKISDAEQGYFGGVPGLSVPRGEQGGGVAATSAAGKNMLTGEALHNRMKPQEAPPTDIFGRPLKSFDEQKKQSKDNHQKNLLEQRERDDAKVDIFNRPPPTRPPPQSNTQLQEIGEDLDMFGRPKPKHVPQRQQHIGGDVDREVEMSGGMQEHYRKLLQAEKGPNHPAVAPAAAQQQRVWAPPPPFAVDPSQGEATQQITSRGNENQPSVNHFVDPLSAPVKKPPVPHKRQIAGKIGVLDSSDTLDRSADTAGPIDDSVPVDIFGRPIAHPANAPSAARKAMFGGDKGRVDIFNKEERDAEKVEKRRAGALPNYIFNPPMVEPCQAGVGMGDGKDDGNGKKGKSNSNKEGNMTRIVTTAGVELLVPESFYQSALFRTIKAACKGWGLRTLRLAMKEFDRDHDGELTKSEFLNATKKAGLDLSPQEVEVMGRLAAAPTPATGNLGSKPPQKILFPKLFLVLHKGDFCSRRRKAAVDGFRSLCAKANKSEKYLTLGDILGTVDLSAHPNFQPHVRGSLRELTTVFTRLWGPEMFADSVVSMEQFVAFCYDLSFSFAADSDYFRSMKGMFG